MADKEKPIPSAGVPLAPTGAAKEVKPAVELGLPEHINKNYLTMLHGKGERALAGISGRDFTPNAYNTDQAILERQGVKIVAHGLSADNTPGGKFGVAEHKLMSVIAAEFTRNNNTAPRPYNRKVTTLKVAINFKWYARQIGFNIDEQPKETEEEQQKEARRAKNALKEARKKITRTVKTLFNTTVTFSEEVTAKNGTKKLYEIADAHIIDTIPKQVIVGDYIPLVMGATYGSYLIQRQMTQYPKCLLGIDERSPAAYAVGCKIAEQYHNDTNRRQGRNDRLKVETLLNVTTLPDINEVRRAGKSWEERIKDPLETALDQNVAVGHIKKWGYRLNDKATPKEEDWCTPAIKMKWSGYEQWAAATITIEMNNPPDTSERDEKKAKRIEKQKAAKGKGGTSAKRA